MREDKLYVIAVKPVKYFTDYMDEHATDSDYWEPNHTYMKLHDKYELAPFQDASVFKSYQDAETARQSQYKYIWYQALYIISFSR